MRVIWSLAAASELDAITEYVSFDSVRAAVSIRRRVLDLTARLADFPQMGRDSSLTGLRELVVSGTAYFVVYRMRDDAIDILRVIHGARQWPPE